MPHRLTVEPPAYAQVKGIDVMLTVDDVSAIYGLAPSTIRWKCRQGLFHPQPARKYPYRWRASDVKRDIETQGDDRYAKHGFATTRKFRTAKVEEPHTNGRKRGRSPKTASGE
jgi:hypothetical protein